MSAVKKALLTIPLIAAWSLLSTLSGCSSSSSRGQGGGVDPSLTVSDEQLRLEQGRWGDGSIPTALEGGLFGDIHFDYDSSVVKPEYMDIIEQSSKVLANDTTLHVEVEGHCDKRGTNEYNLALGEERAKAVATHLVNYGARSAQVSTISYGEEIPIDPGNDESAFAKNRRVHFALYRVKSDGKK